MDKVAIFPGSFDPFTKGHESVVVRSFPIFDKVIIAIGNNSSKTGFFTIDERIKLIESVFKNEPKVAIQSYDGLTVDFCREIGAQFMLRGIRTAADFEYERAIAQMNKSMLPEVESVILLTTPELTPVNSTIVRDILRYGGNVSQFLPDKMDVESVFKARKNN